MRAELYYILALCTHCRPMVTDSDINKDFINIISTGGQLFFAGRENFVT